VKRPGCERQAGQHRQPGQVSGREGQLSACVEREPGDQPPRRHRQQLPLEDGQRGGGDHQACGVPDERVVGRQQPGHRQSDERHRGGEAETHLGDIAEEVFAGAGHAATVARTGPAAHRLRLILIARQ
jgi:hypothetical protein